MKYDQLDLDSLTLCDIGAKLELNILDYVFLVERKIVWYQTGDGASCGVTVMIGLRLCE